MLYVETSAKTSDNVDEAFSSLAAEVLKRIKSGVINPEEEVGYLSRTIARN